jgi:hypothetical protein
MERLWIFLGRCSTLELSKIDFGMVLSNQSIDFGFFWDAAASWNCRKSTLEWSCGTNRSSLDFFGTLLDAGIVENRLWNCLVEPIDQIDFGIYLYGRCSTLELSKIDFGIVEYANGQDCQEKSQ